MSVFSNIYLNFSKRRFLKPFKPLSNKKRRNFLISAPTQAAEFVKVIPYVTGLKKIGHIVMIAPRHHETICSFIKPKNFQIIFYDIPPLVLSKEYDGLKRQLSQERFHYIIELNKPANISLPYLTTTERRICLYDQTKFPYYNIMLRDSVESLCSFFATKKYDAKKIFTFYVRDIKSTMKKYKKNDHYCLSTIPTKLTGKVIQSLLVKTYLVARLKHINSLSELMLTRVSMTYSMSLLRFSPRK